jgi:hypothetical protein
MPLRSRDRYWEEKKEGKEGKKNEIILMKSRNPYLINRGKNI